jgi:diacylglycerol kinase family enzyme
MYRQETSPEQEPVQIFTVLNPVSGVFNADVIEQKLRLRCAEQGLGCQIYRTTGIEDLNEVIHAALEAGANRFIAAGGDGTVSAVANGLLGTGIPVAILPIGTWNALARNFDIPLQLDAAIRLATGAFDLLPVDGMLINGRVYLLNAGVGISSSTMLKTEREQKRRWGFLAYFWNLFLQLFGLKLHNFTLTIDEVKYKTRANEVLVMNSNLTAIKEISNLLELDPSDGKVEVCMIRARSIPDLILVGWNILTRRQRRPLFFESLPATNNISIQSSKPLMVQADGDIIGKTPLNIKVLPYAVPLVVPKKVELIDPIQVIANHLKHPLEMLPEVKKRAGLR